MPPKPKYKRVLFKLSGEAMQGTGAFGFDFPAVERIVDGLCSVVEMGVQLCIVIGAGNILRGGAIEKAGIERTGADYMGMLATVINALALQTLLEKRGVETRVQSAIPVASVCEPYIRRRAVRHMEKGRVVIFAGGTGNPFFTTDTAAALRAVEMNCDALLKGTQVDGVYSADPHKDPDAIRYDKLSYQEVLERELKVMDAAAFVLARENNVPILVFSLHNPKAIADVVQGGGVYTIIC